MLAIRTLLWGQTMLSNLEVRRTERGWAGHFICADRCSFRRNTLLEFKKTKLVVSTVGVMAASPIRYSQDNKRRYEKIGLDRHYETMVFHSKKKDKKYNDADVSKQIFFESNWFLEELDDNKANDMHESAVAELTKKLQKGELE